MEHPERDGEGLELDEVLASGVDMTPVLTRRFTWDTMACSQVPELLTALGLTHGSPEGMDLDHRESHHRMGHVLPLESQLRAYAGIVGTILTKAILTKSELEMEEDDELGFASQNSELVLAGARAIIGQLIYSGVLAHGPLFHQVEIVVLDEEADGGE